MFIGQVIFSYFDDNIDLWWLGVEYNCFKWGVYCVKLIVLQDEVVCFVDFCILEISVDFCFVEVVLLLDIILFSVFVNLLFMNILIIIVIF